ncbi:MAG: TonB-dependent receptor [Aliarcobacter sp.]|nr:TonB-dependent receptor [Aliarcobacter sp.]
MQKKLSISLVASILLATTNLFSAQELETITVTSATKSTQSIKDVTSNVEVITSEEIKERHFTTVSEALNTLAGINVTSNGGLGKSTSVFMRGFDSQRILVLIDGINYNDFTGISGAAFEHLMIDDIEQIEVVKGAQSGIWGADANAGVINIITSSAKEGTHTNVSTEYGSYNTKKVNAGVSHKNKDFDVKLNITRLDTNGFTTQAPSGTDIDNYEDDAYDNTTVNLKSGFNINENNRLELNHNIINTKSEYDKYVYNSDYSKDLVKSANSTGDVLKTKNTYSSLNYLNKNEYSDLKFYTNYSKINRDDATGYTKEFDGTLKEYGTNATIPYFNTNSFVQIGTDYKITNHKNDVNKELNNKGLFITNSTKFNDTVFTQSLRYDNYDLFDNKTTGKIGIKHYFLEDLSLSTNYGTSYNVPTFYKLYDSGAGYADLQPESTKSNDITLAYKEVALTYFHNTIKDMIEYNTSSYSYYNMDGDVTLQGVELSYKPKINDDLLANLSYTYTSAKDDNDKRLQRRAKDSLKFGLDYYGISKFHFNVNGEYVGDRVQYDFGTYDVSAETGNYTLWNTVVNYEINKTFSTYLKVNNLFDKYYQTIDGYATAERSAYVGLKASF